VSDSPHDEGGLEHPAEPLKDLPGLGAFVSLGMTIAVTVGVGTVLGILADEQWSLAPWGLLIGLGLGIGAAVVSVVQLVRRWL
jgi:F0F1-type ATP synthase assembly protein I